MRTNEHNRFLVNSRLVSADLLAIAVVTNNKNCLVYARHNYFCKDNLCIKIALLYREVFFLMFSKMTKRLIEL